MKLYVQYHNVEQEGLPLTVPLFCETRLGIHTRRPHIEGARGRVFLIAGIGKPRHYFLWVTFLIEEVKGTRSGEYEAWGTGWQLAPPQELGGRGFASFKIACANFVGFREITRLPFARTLARLAKAHRPPGNPKTNMDFLYAVRGLLPKNNPALDLVDNALGDFLVSPTLALSVRQPHAEAIMRGIKTIEYRNAATNIRGRVFVYAGLGRYTSDDEAERMDDYGITDVPCDKLPRGGLVGTVELYDCDNGEWYLRNPQRAVQLLKPTKQPQPTWFKPF